MRARGRPQRARLVFVHPQHCGGAVGDLRRGARGVHGAFHHRLEPGQALHGGVAQALVTADHVALVGGSLVLVENRRLDRGDLAVEAVLVPGPLGPLLGQEPEVVEILASDAAAFGNPLGGGELIGHVDVPRGGADQRAVRAGVGAEPDAAHGLDTAGDADVDRAGRDQPGDQVVGLLGAAALAVDGGGTDLLGQAGGQPRHPGDVVRLLAVLGDAATDDLLDLIGVDAGLLDHGPLDSPNNSVACRPDSQPPAFRWGYAWLRR